MRKIEGGKLSDTGGGLLTSSEQIQNRGEHENHICYVKEQAFLKATLSSLFYML